MLYIYVLLITGQPKIIFLHTQYDAKSDSYSNMGRLTCSPRLTPQLRNKSSPKRNQILVTNHQVTRKHTVTLTK